MYEKVQKDEVKGKRKRKKGPRRTCLFCGTSFSSLRNLEDHVHLHTGERPHPCLECDLWFKCFSNLWNHRRVVHLGIKWICEFCQREFNDFPNMLNHKKRMHKSLLNKKGEEKKNVANLTRSEAARVKQKLVTKNNGKLAVTLSTPEKKQKLVRLKSNCRIVRKRKPNPIIPFLFSNHEPTTTNADIADSKNTFPPTPLSFKPQNVPVIYRPQRRICDSSFFLHMNRYKPDKEKSCALKLAHSETGTLVTIKVEGNVEPKVIDSNTPRKKRSMQPSLWNLKGDTDSNSADVEHEKIVVGHVGEEDTKIPISLCQIKVENCSDEEKSQENGRAKNADNSKPSFKCKKCEKVLSHKWSFQNHQKIANCVLRKQIQENKQISSLRCICLFCKKDFGERRHNLVRHIVGVHRYKEDDVEEDAYKKGSRRLFSNYSCGFCGVYSEEKEDLQRHIIIRHNELLGVARDCL